MTCPLVPSFIIVFVSSLYFILRAFEFCLNACLYTTYVHGACGGQKGVPDFLKLKLRTVVT